TAAVFKESGTDLYYADGKASVIDKVVYDNLLAGESYTLKAILVDKKTGEKELETEKEFIPESEAGEVIVEYESFDLDELPDTDHVSFEYLYLTEDYVKLQESLTQDDSQGDSIIPYSPKDPYLLAYHEDLDDEAQTVHVKALYKAEMILCKTGKDDIRLNGAYFDISTRRIKRDGSVVEQDLGRYVTGGIYYEREEPFRLIVARDEQMRDIIRESVSTDDDWNIQSVTILGLNDGIYYVQVEGEETIRKWIIATGLIYLEDQPEDTQITYTEILAPKGYYLDPEPYVVDVGHDTSLASITNYRVNKAVYIPAYIPITGVD
ncbi:MAG: VaFE repeat-containing surface-anchored protein, partial [Erysipelotrichaceae bacterium]|nr:VaFE repeat-containing surface-anchored protein [Erysipelotrichaceae bacterium]